VDFLYRFSMNATNILLDEIADRRPPEGKVSVEIFYKNEVSDGSFDFTTWKGSGLSADEVLPKTSREKIEVLSSSLNGMVEYYKSQSNGAFSPEPGHPMAASAWKGKLCRAACWGVAGAASAFCCAGTAGIACILCAGAEAALASMCSDSCPT